MRSWACPRTSCSHSSPASRWASSAWERSRARPPPSAPTTTCCTRSFSTRSRASAVMSPSAAITGCRTSCIRRATAAAPTAPASSVASPLLTFPSTRPGYRRSTSSGTCKPARTRSARAVEAWFSTSPTRSTSSQAPSTSSIPVPSPAGSSGSGPCNSTSICRCARHPRRRPRRRSARYRLRRPRRHRRSELCRKSGQGGPRSSSLAVSPRLRAELPEPVPRAYALAGVPGVPRAVVQGHPRVQRPARPLVEPAAGAALDLVAEPVREAPAPRPGRDAVLRADLEDVADRSADEPIEEPSGRQPGGENEIRPRAPDRGEGVDAEDGRAEPHSRHVLFAKLAALSRAHTRAGVGPGAGVARHDLQAGRGLAEGGREEPVSGGNFEYAPRSERADAGGERSDELARRQEEHGPARIQFADPEQLASAQPLERCVQGPRGGNPPRAGA